LSLAVVAQIRDAGVEITRCLSEVDQLGVSELAPSKKVYIPVLRGLRTLPKNSEPDAFTERTRADYFAKLESNAAPEVFTGLTLYEEVRNHLLGPRAERDRVRRYEEFLSSRFFDSRGVTLIPRRDGDVLYVKVGRAPERPIHELGDAPAEPPGLSPSSPPAPPCPAPEPAIPTDGPPPRPELPPRASTALLSSSSPVITIPPS
jgi:hypothetical protein